VVVACPATPQDNYSMLRAALACGDPVVYMEHKTLWGLTGEVDPTEKVKLGEARIVRPGRELTIVSWSKQVQACEQACDELAASGIAPEIIDLRSIWPWDRATVLSSVARTRNLLVVHEAVQAAGFGAEIAATVAETVGGCKVRRLGAPRIPVGYAPVLEAQSRVTASDIAAAARGLLA
jgi:pyruvate/2-oxoglutarate/acetoin dehydrogenase E1 component